MKLRNLAVLVFVLGLVGACTLPLSAPNEARVAFKLLLPAPAASSGPSRLVAAETTLLRVTVKTPSKADQVQTFVPTASEVGSSAVNVVIQTTVGPHTFVIQTLDTGGNVLTIGDADAVLIKGANALSITLLPPVELTAGSNVAVTAGITYFTLPPAGMALTFEGVASTFWDTSAAGVFTGGGDVGAITLDVTGGADKFLRVDQSASGTINVYQPTVADVAFNPPAGSQSQDFSLTLSSATSGADIVYWIDGVGPTAYLAPIDVKGDGTAVSVVAQAKRTGYLDSAQSAIQDYTIDYSKVSDVAFSPEGGTFVTDQFVVLTDTTPSADIEYSTNNQVSYSPYTPGAQIPVAGDGTQLTIWARAKKTGMTTSTPVSFTYKIQYPAITIDFAIPVEPVILGEGAMVTLDKSTLMTLNVTLDNAGFDSYIWFIDGHTDTYLGTSQPLQTWDGTALLLESQYMSVGKHEILVMGLEGSQIFSASFLVEVVQ